MLDEVEKIEKRHSELLNELFELEHRLIQIRIACDHAIDSQDGTFFLKCKHCETQLKLGCKKNSKGFHIYEPGKQTCVYCGIQIIGK